MKTMTHWDNNLIKILSNPNFLTMFRIAASPVIVVFLLFPNRVCTFLAALIFSVAAITDFLDGFFARRHGLVSNLGKIIDPMADKLLVSTSFIMLTSLGWIPAWIVCAIVGRELAITGLRNVITEFGGDVAASKLGKYKTGFQIAAIIPLMIHYKYFGIDFHAIGYFLLWGALIFTLWSGADYVLKCKKLIEN